MHFVAIMTPEQMDLLALHRVRSRLVGQRTGVINQIRGFLIERGITVRQGAVPLRKALPDILSSNTDVLSPRMVRLIADLAQDWRRLDERIATVSAEIEALAQQDDGCQRFGDRQWRRLQARTRLRRLAGARAKAGVDGRYRTILGKISKRGNKYLRTLFVQAAHVVLVRRPRTAMPGLWPWIERASNIPVRRAGTETPGSMLRSGVYSMPQPSDEPPLE